MIFDPNQETQEEYLRRMHLNDNLKTEWNNNDQKEKEKNKVIIFRRAVRRRNKK